MKSNRWYCHFPGDAYAMGVWEFGNPINEKEFRAHVREWAKTHRLPNGFECWRTV